VTRAGGGELSSGASRSDSARVALIAVGYMAAFYVYNWLALENDRVHWLSFVFVPVLLLWLLHRGRSGRPWRAALGHLGLEPSRLGSGVLVGAGSGLVAGAVLLGLGRSGSQFAGMVRDGRVWVYLPAAFVLLLVTAGFTEEVMFRGFLQTAIERWTRRKWVAIVFAATLFGFYHLPYRLLLPDSEVRGNWSASVGECVLNSLVGILLGWVYARRQNLLAAVLCHVGFDLLVATTMMPGILRNWGLN
jgi:membrane protease YdiL (CAAX protease family)